MLSNNWVGQKLVLHSAPPAFGTDGKGAGRERYEQHIVSCSA